MGGFAGVVRGALAGLNEAAGNPDTAAALRQRQQQEQQGQMDELRAKILPHQFAIKGLQTKLQSLDPQKDAEQYAAITHDIARNLAEVRQYIHPDKDSKGNFFERGITDKIHLTSLKNRQDKEKAAQTKGAAEDESGASALTQGTVPYTQTPEALAEKQRTEDSLREIAARNATPKTPAETGDVRARADFSTYQKDHPEYKGSFEQWKTEQAGAGRNASKIPSRDDRYIAIEQKKSQGEPLTADEKSYGAAYDLWVKKTKTDPAVARAVAYGANRYIPVIDNSDPDNPGKVTVMKAADAAREHAGTPASIAFQTDKALQRAFTSGNEAKTITAFNTASGHLKMLQDAATALGNGDTPLFNRLSVAYQKATGNPAPTNFEAIRAAASGEVAKTFGELNIPGVEAVTAPLATSGSPAQLAGVIGADYDLMQSKLEGLKGQYEAGREGKPNFSGPKMQQLQGTRSGQSGNNRPPKATRTARYNGKTYWTDDEGNNLGEKK